jgi:hypothetical protein
MRELQGGLFAEPSDLDPASRLRRFAHATRRQWETGSRVLAIYRGAASADREAAAELVEALHVRRNGLDSFTKSLGPASRSCLSMEHASAAFQRELLPWEPTMR